MINYIKSRINKLHHKRLFLFGAYISIIIIASISTILDLLVQNYIDAPINFLSALVAFLSYRFICREYHNFSISASTLFWIVAVTEFIYIIVHQVDFNIIFTVLIPILAFFTMKKKAIIVNLAIYYFILISLMTYYYFSTSGNYILHNFAYIHSFAVAQIYIIIFGIFYYLSIEEFIKRLENSNQTKKILLNEVHHRVKNNLNLIASIIGLQELSAKNKETKETLEQNRHRVESIAILHEVLHRKHLLDSVDTRAYFENIIKKILESSSMKNINLTLKIDNIRISMNSILQLGIMLNEMLLNTLKHNINNKIEIKFIFTKIDNNYFFIYCDNSKNIDINKLTKGFGYSLINLSASTFNSEIKIDNNDHLCYNILLQNLGEFIEL